MTADDIKEKLKAAAILVAEATQALDIEKMKARRAELEKEQASPDLYSDVKRARAVNTEAKYIDDTITNVASLNKRLNDAEEMTELLQTENADGDFYRELEAETLKLEQECTTLHLATLLTGEYDHGNAILALHSGAGGTEAQDWVQMLYRMYSMYCQKHGYSLEELDRLDGEEAGIKSVTFRVVGVNAYGYLKAEKGVHRLVRISPFDSNARRHTSFASLEVMPEIENDSDVVIRSEDLRVDTYRSSGAGGQHINKTDSAIRLTHLPTGIVVTCQNERSQVQNRETAMTMLRSKLVELKEREAMEKAAQIKGTLKKIEWGSQIRSYVFQPYTMVKDHRTGSESTDVAAVMDGNLDSFIFDYLKQLR